MNRRSYIQSLINNSDETCEDWRTMAKPAIASPVLRNGLCLRVPGNLVFCIMYQFVLHHSEGFVHYTYKALFKRLG